MQQSLAPEQFRIVAESSLRDEYTDCMVYQALSNHERKQQFKDALKTLAETERAHYEFWKAYAPEVKVSVNRLRVSFVLLVRLLLGLTFTMKFLERHEEDVIRKYEQVAIQIPSHDRPRFDSMVKDEREHENYLIGGIQEGRVKYMSFIVLGLADAVVEVAGIHAGSLGIYKKTELAGLAGVIAGMAASIAMATAAFAQAKQGFEGSAQKSAVYTGVSYMITAFLLATPYFLTKNQPVALASSLIVGMVLVALITYYDTVISNRVFTRQFGEIAAVILAASVALYIVGNLIGGFLGISI